MVTCGRWLPPTPWSWVWMSAAWTSQCTLASQVCLPSLRPLSTPSPPPSHPLTLSLLLHLSCCPALSLLSRLVLIPPVPSHVLCPQASAPNPPPPPLLPLASTKQKASPQLLGSVQWDSGRRWHCLVDSRTLQCSSSVTSARHSTAECCLPNAGSVASLWQQAGRAGRREQPSTSIYIAFDGPLDQFFMKQPDKLFGRAIECAQVSCA